MPVTATKAGLAAVGLVVAGITGLLLRGEFNLGQRGVVPDLSWHAVSASVESEDTPYAYSVDARKDADGMVTAHVHGPVDEGSGYSEKLFYEAIGRDLPSDQLSIAKELNTATLEAVLVVEWCTDERGESVAAGCPIGQAVDLHATWHSGSDLEEIASDQDPNVFNRVRGRITQAHISIQGRTAMSASYAEIVRNDASIVKDGAAEN